MTKIKNKHMLKTNRPSGKITPSAGSDLYDQAIFKDERIKSIDFDVKCSYIEIYNEQIFDLLD